MNIQLLKLKTALIIVITNLLINTFVYGQSPDKMSYQAVIRNSSNALVVSHTVGMRISILQGSATGTEVYAESQTPTTNANGLVSIEIGNGPGFASINWAAGPYFIKTETDPTGGTNYTISGTSQLLSVPYSLNAKTAETADYNNLSNLPTLNIANWDTAFGWGNHATVGYLTSFTELDPKVGTNTSNYISKWDGTALISSTIYDDGTKIGIGTANPDAKLDIAGQVKISGGNPGAGKILTSDANGLASWENKTGNISNYGYANGPCTTPATTGTYTWCGPKVTLVITSPSQKVLLTACLALGASSPAAWGLDIFPAYCLTSGSTPTIAGNGAYGYSCPANTRSCFTTTAVITGLAPGTYYFGSIVRVGCLYWNNNEWGNVTAILIN